MIILVCLFTSACATQDASSIDTTNLSSLQDVNSSHLKTGITGDVSNLRLKALKETAMALGAQGGLAWRAKQINENLASKAIYLRNIFNFYPLVLAHGILPPVLQQGDHTLKLDDPNTIRIADRTYRILEQAKFVTTPPTWRNYLWLDYTKPTLPDKTLLPRNHTEQAVWAKSVRVGWDNGIHQANNIFQQNLARLQRDYQGIILYRKLLAQHIVSAPHVATTDLGITNNGNTMHINDRVLRITALPKLQSDSHNWKPQLVEQPHDR